MSIYKPDKPQTLIRSFYQNFWKGFNEESRKNDAFIKCFTPHPYGSTRSYQDYHIGEPFHVVVGINFHRHEIRVGAYFSDIKAYDSYYKEKSTIEDKIGRKLKWSRHQTKGSAFLYATADFDENYGWEDAFEVAIENMLLINNTFKYEQESR